MSDYRSKLSVLDIMEQYAESAKPMETPRSIHDQMYRKVFEHNQLLVQEIKRLKTLLHQYEGKARLDAERELREQFPIKRRRRR